MKSSNYESYILSPASVRLDLQLAPAVRVCDMLGTPTDQFAVRRCCHVVLLLVCWSY